WPTAHVITTSSDSRKCASSFVLRPRFGFVVASSTASSAVFLRERFGAMSSSVRRWNAPSSAVARSRPTDGFSAMTSVLATGNNVANGSRRDTGRVRPSPFYLFAGAVTWPIVRGLYRLRAEGVENVPPSGGLV